MSIGHKIIDEIGLQGMVTIGHPDPEASHVFVWSSNSAEQLEALVADHTRELREGARRADFFEHHLRRMAKEFKRRAQYEDAHELESVLAEAPIERDEEGRPL